MKNTFSTGSMIRSGWATFKRHWKFILLAMLATGIVQGLLQVLQNHARNAGGIFSALVTLGSVIIGIIIALGWANVILAMNRSDRADWEGFKTNAKMWLKYIKAAIWYTASVLLWVLLAVLPFAILAVIGLMTSVKAIMVIGIVLGGAAFVVTIVYLAIRYQFLVYVILDNPTIRSRDMVRKAGALTKGRILDLLGFGIVCGLVNLLGLVCLIIGLLATIPTVKLAQARVYDFLKSEYDANHHSSNAA